MGANASRAGTGVVALKTAELIKLAEFLSLFGRGAGVIYVYLYRLICSFLKQPTPDS